jgi:hypothetical protein
MIEKPGFPKNPVSDRHEREFSPKIVDYSTKKEYHSLTFTSENNGFNNGLGN